MEIVLIHINLHLINGAPKLKQRESNFGLISGYFEDPISNFPSTRGMFWGDLCQAVNLMKIWAEQASKNRDGV